MRTLGILGGMSWESTAVYYRLLNQGVAQRLGGLHIANATGCALQAAGAAHVSLLGTRFTTEVDGTVLHAAAAVDWMLEAA